MHEITWQNKQTSYWELPVRRLKFGFCRKLNLYTYFYNQITRLVKVKGKKSKGNIKYKKYI